MKRILYIALVCLFLVGCTAAPAETTACTTATSVQTEPETTAVVGGGDLVGICLPDEAVRRWVAEAADLTAALSELGYRAEVCYAGSDAMTQAQQVQTLVEKGVACLIIAAVDSVELTEAEELARKAHIPVVAYDRLLMDTEAVCAYVGYDYAQIGRDMAAYVVETKVPSPEEPYTLELLMGSPEDANALRLYQGLMEQLQPLLDSGALLINSGRSAFEDCCIVGWDSREAGGRFARTLAESYRLALPDIVLAASDDMVICCLDVLAGLERNEEPMPLFAGIGGEMIGGQAVTFSANTRALAEPAAMLAHQLITGLDLTVTDWEGCYNNAITLPAYFIRAEMVSS